MRTRKFLSALIPALPMLLTALLVILVTVIFLTAMRSKAHAQFGGVEQPMFQMTSTDEFTPQSIAGLAYWWNSEDLTTNVTVTNWIDRIQGVVLTNGNNATRPTNHVFGVGFNGSRQLTNLSIIYSDGAITYFYVVRWTDPNHNLSPITGYGPGTDPLIDIGLASSSWAATWNANSRWFEVRGATTKIRCAGANNSVPTNSTITLSGVITIGDVGTWYTNGVQSFTQSGVAGDYGIQYVGWMRDAWGFVGHIREILVYTNALTSANVSNLNYFAVKP